MTRATKKPATRDSARGNGVVWLGPLEIDRLRRLVERAREDGLSSFPASVRSSFFGRSVTQATVVAAALQMLEDAVSAEVPR